MKVVELSFGVNDRMKYSGYYVNDQIDYYILALKELLVKNNLFKREVKNLFNRGERELRSYHKLMKSSLSIDVNEYKFSDIMQAIEDAFENDFKILSFCVSEFFNERNVTGDLNDIATYLGLIEIMSCTTSAIYDEYRIKFKNRYKLVDEAFEIIHLSTLHYSMHQLCPILIPGIDDIDLVKDDNILAAYNKVTKDLLNADCFRKAVLELLPEAERIENI